MRIDQVGAAANIQPMPSQSSSSGASDSRPEVRPAQPVKRVSKSEPTMQQKQEIHHAEAEVAADRRSAENEQQVIAAIEKANKQFRTYDRKLEFSIHDATKEIMVKVINTSDDTVIREIPSEKVLDMVAHMWEIAGILVDEKR